jgi:DNA-binding CsgD family transcriptional regulator
VVISSRERSPVSDQLPDTITGELKICDLLRKGLSSQEIADAFHLSKNTVDTHRRKMLKKARVKNTIELITLTRKT